MSETALWEEVQKALAIVPAAQVFAKKLVDLLHVWDDLIDKDHKVGDAAINAAFWDALIELPRNPFYAQHFAELNPVLRQAIVNWHVANLAERGGGVDDKRMAFILRSAYVDVIAASLVIIHGWAAAVPLVHRLRRFTHREGFDGYLAALEKEKEARNVL